MPFIIQPGSISDGYHTFGELYEHRYWLWLKLCELLSVENNDVWRAKLHSDGSMFEDSFVLGYGMDQGEQLTYHLPLRLWNKTTFANTLERAPKWDGHTPADVLERLKEL